MLLAIRLNGFDTGDVVPAAQLGPDCLALPLTDLGNWQLKAPPKPVRQIGNRHYACIEDIDGAHYRIDPATQTLLLEVPPTAFAGTEIPGNRAAGRLTPSYPGGFLNYDLLWTRSDGSHGGSGLFELGTFNRVGSGTTTALWNQAGAVRQLVRLDTTWSMDMPERMQTIRLGDMIGRPGAWGRALRMGGIQWSTNFGTQPNFVPFPLPGMHGEAALPSTVDVFVNNVQRLHSDVPAGPFDLPSVPVTTGQGEIRLMVRDLLGRQQIITQPYFASQRLLRPELHDFSFEAGFARRDYGIENSHYGQAVLAATDRVGISPELTGEVRAEATREQQTMGASAIQLLAGFGTASLSGAVSRSPDGSGTLVAAAVERQATGVGYSLQVQRQSPDFAQLGTLPDTRPRQLVTANLSVPVVEGILGLSYVRQSTWQGNEVELVGANQIFRIAPFSQLHLYLLRDLANTGRATIGAVLTLALDERTSATADIGRQRGLDQALAGFQRSPPEGDGWGYRAFVGRGQIDQFNGSIVRRSPYGDATAEVASFGAASAVRAGFSGGVALAAGSAFVGRRLDDSFAIVRIPGEAGIPVYRDNVEVARTNPSGLALITRLRPYQENLVSVDPNDLPLDAEADSVQLKLTPALRSGVVATFLLRRSRAATLRVIDENGRPPPPGAVIRIEGQSRTFPIGYDGKAFVTGPDAAIRLLAQWAGHRCTVEFEPPQSPREAAKTHTVICREKTQ